MMTTPTPPPVPGSTWSLIRLIAAREIRQRLKAKSFYLLTAIIVIVILAVGILYRLIGDDGLDEVSLGVMGDVPAEFDTAVRETGRLFDLAVTVTEIESVDIAGIDRIAASDLDGSIQQALRDADVDALLIPEANYLVFPDNVDSTLNAVVSQAWASVSIVESMSEAGLSDAQIGQLLQPEPLDAIASEDSNEVSGLAVLVGSATAVMLFMSLQVFGTYVLTGVVEEKSTAVVEVLLARVRSDQLLAGKVLGIGLVALLQFAVAVVSTLAALAISGISVPSEIWASVPTALLWFLLGYTMYSTVYALAGSLVSRQEDAQAAAAPILTVMLAGYMVVFLFGYDPYSQISTILSLIPPITPFLMPMRMAAGAAPIWQILLSVLLSLLTIFGAWKLSARIYSQVLLRRGTRIGWLDALRLGRQN